MEFLSVILVIHHIHNLLLVGLRVLPLVIDVMHVQKVPIVQVPSRKSSRAKVTVVSLLVMILRPVDPLQMLLHITAQLESLPTDHALPLLLRDVDAHVLAEVGLQFEGFPADVALVPGCFVVGGHVVAEVGDLVEHAPADRALAAVLGRVAAMGNLDTKIR